MKPRRKVQTIRLGIGDRAEILCEDNHVIHIITVEHKSNELPPDVARNGWPLVPKRKPSGPTTTSWLMDSLRDAAQKAEKLPQWARELSDAIDQYYPNNGSHG